MKLDMTVRLGDLVLAGGMIAGILLAWSGFDKRLALAEQKMGFIQERLDQLWKWWQTHKFHGDTQLVEMVVKPKSDA